jgi:hypothetical protein
MTASTVFLLLLVLACPLMMMLMMRGGHGHSHGSEHEHHDEGATEATTAELLRHRAELDRLIEEREQEELETRAPAPHARSGRPHPGQSYTR